ncbi:MAG: phosphotransferase [Eubacteriales bacterium]|nr:phosphotransferase [Eubacteriales bacterium]
MIQESLDFIEQNLKAEISAEELSARSGYSSTHYCRLFLSAVGIPIQRYIAKRRLLWAAYGIANGKKQIDAALEYGFDTSAGFYKAFMREFGCSPSYYARRFRARKPYRVNLLKEERLMITHKKVSKLLENWGLQGETVSAVILSAGLISENTFRIGDKYILKALTSLGAIKKSAEISRLLYAKGLSQAEMMKTKDGMDYAEDGEVYYTLTPKIDGEPISAREMYDENAPITGETLGEIIGRLHLALESSDIIVCNESNLLKEALDSLPAAKRFAGLSDSFCDDFTNAAAGFDGKLPVKIIHRDINPGNILFKNGRLAGFIDFDLSQRGIRLFDACYAATAILSESLDIGADEKMEKWTEIYRGIIRGYDKTVRLNDAEKRAAAYVLFSIELICTAYFAGLEKYEELAQTNARMLRWMAANKERLSF